MSYYPTERRGGCMESISRCCRQAYVYPVDTRKLLYVAGAVVGVILVVAIWTGFSSSTDGGNAEPFKGSSILQTAPLIVGCNFFPLNLRDLVHNNVSKVHFDEDLKNDSVFGDKSCSSCQTDLERLESGLVSSQIWSISVPCDAMFKDAVALTLEQIDAVSRLIDNYPTKLKHVQSSKDLTKTKEMGSILGITTGLSMDGRLAVLRTFKNLGVRVMSLASNCLNASWATSYTDTEDKGLSAFGKAVVAEMNRLGILIDLSDSSHQTQLDVLKVSKAPVIFSHSAAYGLVNNPRNVQDDVLEQLKENNGVVMVTFAQQYISNNAKNASIINVIDHINYIKNKTGVTGVGIGSEFDAKGETFPSALSDVASFPTLFDQLGSSWTNHDDLKSLAGGNLLRVFEAVERYKEEAQNLPVDETYMLPTNSSCYSDYESRKSEDITTTVQPTETPTTPKSTTTLTTPTTTVATTKPTTATTPTTIVTTPTTPTTTQPK